MTQAADVPRAAPAVALAVRFLVEISALIAVGAWVASLADSAVVQALLAVLLTAVGPPPACGRPTGPT